MTEFRWKECPENLPQNNKYSIDESNPRIVTKINEEMEYVTVVGEAPLPLNTTSSWIITMLSLDPQKLNDPLVGVAPADIDQKANGVQHECGWYLNCCRLELISGPPHNYWGKKYGPWKGYFEKYVQTKVSVGVVVDTTKGEVSFLLNGVDLGVAYEGIPLDKPLVPCVLLGNKDDSIELELSEVRMSEVNCEISAPFDIKAKSETWDSITLTWEEVKDAQFYQVEVGGNKFLSSTANTKVVRHGLNPTTSYSFRVRTVGKNEVSAWSDPVEVTTEKVPAGEWEWKKCPYDVDDYREYSVDDENPRIASKSGDLNNSVIIGNMPLPPNQVSSWGVKLLVIAVAWSHTYIGVAPFDVDQDLDQIQGTCGWYFDCRSSELYSGPPHNYSCKKYGPRKGDGKYVRKKDIVGVVMDTTKGELSFTLKGKDLGVAYTGIPLDKPLVPCVAIDMEDTVELIVNNGKSKKGGKECIIS